MMQRSDAPPRMMPMHDAMTPRHPAASIVVVTHNALAHTERCLASIVANSAADAHELIIVDNASDAAMLGRLVAFADAHALVTLVLNRRNLGFARANNQGLALARHDFFVLLNSDTVVPRGWLARLLRPLGLPGVGLAGAMTNAASNEARIAVTYDQTTLAGLEEFAAARARRYAGYLFDIPVAIMYCLALSRATYTTVGPLDERFGIGLFEDDDYAHRVRLAGLRIVCAEDAFVHHVGSASFREAGQAVGEPAYQALYAHNQRLFEEKWGIGWQPHQQWEL